MPAEALAVQVRAQRGAFMLDVAFELPPGLSALVGPSGSGKTTTLEVLAGLGDAVGTIRLGAAVWLDSSSGRHVPAERRRVGVVFQAPALFPHLSVDENVAFGARGEDVGRWFERLGLAHLRGRRVQGLSGGEAQRVALARACASHPSVLLLDEPFAALDVSLREVLGREVKALVDELGVPALLVTHDEAEAKRLAARVLRLADGRLQG